VLADGLLLHMIFGQAHKCTHIPFTPELENPTWHAVYLSFLANAAAHVDMFC
jgi:hypothetical protein